MTSEQKLHKAKIIGQIQSCYSNIAKSLDTTISHEDFTNAYKESIAEGEAFKFYTQEVIKGFCESSLRELEKSDSATSRSDIDKELSGLEKITIVADNGIPVSIFAQTKDLEKGDYLDNALNRFLGRIDIEKAEGSKGGKVIGHTKSGKPIYAHMSGEGYTHEDHSDAMGVHMNTAKHHHEIRMKDSTSEMGKQNNSSKYEHHSSMAQLHNTAMNQKLDKKE